MVEAVAIDVETLVNIYLYLDSIIQKKYVHVITTLVG